MKEKKRPTKAGAFKVLFIIPVTLIIDAILIRIGYSLDSAMYAPKPDMPGFMVPVFTMLSMLIAIVISIIMFIVMIVLLITGLKKADKASKNET